MSTRHSRSGRMQPPRPSQAIQHLRRGTQLVAELRQKFELNPLDLDLRKAAAALMSQIAEFSESSLSILLSTESEHSSSDAGALAVASPAGHSSAASAETRHGASARTGKVRHRRARLGEKLPIREILTDAPENDHYHWRKYGEKKILNAEYPRLYYKCGYSDDHKCPAKKYVQRQNSSHPPQYMVTLIHEHTCETLFQNVPCTSIGSSQVFDFAKASICPPLMAGTTGLEKEEETWACTSTTHSCENELSAYR